ncbi:tellurite resistance protein [Mycobacterium sp. URHB0021]
MSAIHRARWLGYYSLTLGLGGLGGVWRTAGPFGAPAIVADTLDVLCALAWATVTIAYFRHGGLNPRAFATDLRHRQQGFTAAYMPVIPLLLLAHVGRGVPAARILDMILLTAWAMITAALVAQWITRPSERRAIHPGLSMPVVAGPFIAAISLQANGWGELAPAMFILGAFFWLIFTTLIMNRLMSEEPLSDARYPSLAVLMVPPATGSLAWFAMHGNRVTTIGAGLAAILAMMALIQLFILPEYLRRPFTMSAWVFTFPVAASANTVGHWGLAAPGPAAAPVVWVAVAIATSVVALLGIHTTRMFANHIIVGIRQMPCATTS